jgi:serine/threonine protein kinase
MPDVKGSWTERTARVLERVSPDAPYIATRDATMSGATWGYLTGTAGVANVPAGGKVLTITALAGSDGSPSIAIAGGAAIALPQGASLTIRSDIYAVAVLIYEMLCGVPPFQGDNAMEIMLKHVNEPAPKLTVPELRGTPFDWAIQKGLAKKPEQRFRDAHEFLAALGGTAVTAAGERPQSQPVETSAFRQPSTRAAGPPPIPADAMERAGFFGTLFKKK